MDKEKSSVLSKKDLSNENLSSDGWDGAILQAEAQIQEAKQRIAILKTAIGTFKHLKESGAPYPSRRPKQSESKA